MNAQLFRPNETARGAIFVGVDDPAGQKVESFGNFVVEG